MFAETVASIIANATIRKRSALTQVAVATSNAIERVAVATKLVATTEIRRVVPTSVHIAMTPMIANVVARPREIGMPVNPSTLSMRKGIPETQTEIATGTNTRMLTI